MLRWIDRGSRDVFNGVKILALSSAQLQIKEFKFYFLKFLNLIFSISGTLIFFKISGIVGGRQSIDVQSYRTSWSQGKYEGQIFEHLVGGPSVPGGSQISKTVTVDR